MVGTGGFERIALFSPPNKINNLTSLTARLTASKSLKKPATATKLPPASIKCVFAVSWILSLTACTPPCPGTYPPPAMTESTEFCGCKGVEIEAHPSSTKPEIKVCE